MPAVLKYAALLCAVLSGCAKAAAPAEESLPSIMLVAEMSGEYENTYTRDAFDGILRFYGESMENQKRRGLLYDVYVCEEQDTDSLIATLQELSDEKAWDVIATAGEWFSAALREVAPHNPRQKYVVIDTFPGVRLDNFRQYAFVEQEGCYLVGAAAALKAIEDGIQNPVFGFIGGERSSAISRFEAGYINGVNSVLPDAPINIFYANSWGDPDAAYAVANEWYENGVFAVFSAAGGTGSGTIAAAREFRLNGKNVWAIGVDVDQYDEGLYKPDTSAVYTSMIKRVDEAIYDALTAVKNGTFSTNNDILFNLKSHGIGYTVTNPAMSADVIRQLNRIEENIITGKASVMRE
jgi:basic membrane protein A